MNRMRIVHLLLWLVLTTCSIQPVTADVSELAGLDVTVQQVMEQLSIPGLGVAVVRDDRVLLARGFGVREIGHDETVDERTLFALGSASKAFTATALGLLVDDGKIAWDDPLSKHIPGFQVADAYISLNLSVRDALSHRTGLDPANGLMMANTQIGRPEMLARLAYLEPVLPFRSRYLYNNLMYIAASEVIPAVSGQSWEILVQERIFNPLGMSDSIANSGVNKPPTNLAMPHAVDGEAVRPIPYFDMTTAAPAGGILSSVKDMAQWCRAQLNDGRLGGKQQIPAGIIPGTHQPVVGTGKKTEHLFEHGLHFNFYAMGWTYKDYRQQTMISHEGGIDGMSAYVSLLPEQKLCVVTLSNLSPMGNTHLGLFAIHNWIYDRFLGVESMDWVAHVDDSLNKMNAAETQEAEEQKEQRVKHTSPSHKLAEYVGVFHHPLQGNIVITFKNEKLRLLYGENFNATLEHWNFDTFRAHWDQPGQPPVPIQFLLDTAGRVNAIEAGDRYRRISD